MYEQGTYVIKRGFFVRERGFVRTPGQPPVAPGQRGKPATVLNRCSNNDLGPAHSDKHSVN